MKQAACIWGRRTAASLLLAALALVEGRGGMAETALDPSAPRPSILPGGEIFDRPTVLNVHLQLVATNLQALRDRPREYTPATVVVNGQSFTNVGVKLKGAAGSFRPVDDRPALTLHFSKYADGRRLFGLRRLHLNNSVQDPSYMSEYVGSELFRAAGVPTPRVAWATVRIGDRKLGLYVLKEAFEKEFLRCFFEKTDGNLYDGGFVRDINQDLDRESGDGPSDRSDLQALVATVHEKDLPKRWARLQQLLDVDRFATYAALSLMLADWDGYPLNRNNYRVYFRPEDGRAVFLPHGMDQLFQRSYLELDGSWSGMVAWGLFECPPGQKLYEARCREVFANVFRLDQITNTIARLTETLRPVHPDIVHQAGDLQDRVVSRFRSLRRDPILKPPPPPPQPAPVAGAPGEGIRPADWRQQSGGDARLEGPLEADGRRVLAIAASNHSNASWRSDVKLKQGRYRFEGRVRTNGVQAVRDDKGEGAGLRVAGMSTPRANKLAGDAGWTSLSCDFEVPSPEATVTLVCELRATRGNAWFDVDSLRVVKSAP